MASLSESLEVNIVLCAGGMSAEDCSIPIFPLIGSARIFYVASCMTITIASIALQLIFALTCQKMKGWKSDFAFYLLQVMAFIGVMSYIGFLVSYIHGLFLFDSPLLSRITGSNYQGSFFAFVFADLCLTVHRLFYTLVPLKAHCILTTRIEKTCIVFILIIYGAYMAITLSPLASVEFCAAHFYFYYGEDTPLKPVISGLNKVFNYVIGLSGITAYVIMFTTLFFKGTLTFKRNREIRMTIQAAVVSVFELLFFVYWEFGTITAISGFWQRTLDGYSMLIYYDILILPYMICNKNVKTEIKCLFWKKNSTTPIVVNPEVDRK